MAQAKNAKKSTNKQSNIDNLRSAAFLVTVGSAMLYGFLWAAAGIVEEKGPTPAWFNNLQNILLVVIVGGGVAMGLLYMYNNSPKNKK